MKTRAQCGTLVTEKWDVAGNRCGTLVTSVTTLQKLELIKVFVGTLTFTSSPVTE